ncbi:MAG: hypothetical protein LBG74_02195 [Spirochaetaceae bacterium]|jgi:hypothetical protein|nr:hypothetical protein [Spirochaetaceae bacterium]
MKKTITSLMVLAFCAASVFAQKKADPKAPAAPAAPAAAATNAAVVLYYSDNADKDDPIAQKIGTLAKADVFKISADGKAVGADGKTAVDVTKYKTVYLGSVVKGETKKETVADPVKTYLAATKLTNLNVAYYGTTMGAAAVPEFGKNFEALIATSGGKLIPKSNAKNILVSSAADKAQETAIKGWLGVK